MYAVLNTGGKQYLVAPGEKILIERLESKEGSTLEMDALWSSAEKDAQPGNSGGKVKAVILRHLRGKKLIVFKKRPKSNYVRRKGHRQDLTEIEIKDIVLN